MLELALQYRNTSFRLVKLISTALNCAANSALYKRPFPDQAAVMCLGIFAFVLHWSTFDAFRCILEIETFCFGTVFTITLGHGALVLFWGGVFASLFDFVLQNLVLQLKTYFCTRCITLKRVTSLQGPSPRHCTCGKHSSFRRHFAVVVSSSATLCPIWPRFQL